MNDGRTRLAHKLEVGVDMESGVVAAVTVQTMEGGDTVSLLVTLDKTARRLADVGAEPEEVVADKGYYSNATMTGTPERGPRTYVSEPNRGRRKWKGKRDAQKAMYGNRRRIRGERGKRLLRERGERLERTFAHLLVSGGMRRVHVRGQEEIRKRMLVHTAAFNLGLLIGQIRRILGLLGHSGRLPPPVTPLLAQQHRDRAPLPACTTGSPQVTSSTDC